MQKISRWLPLLLALALLLTACGGETQPPVQEDDGPTINYEDYVKPVTDRRITDLITAEEISAFLGYSVSEIDGATESVVSYQSADGMHTITLVLEKMTRTDFDAIIANPDATWTFKEGVGEIAYWDVAHTELIGYENGYAISMSVTNIADAVMVSIVDTVLGRVSV